MSDTTATFKFLRDEILANIAADCIQLHEDLDELLDSINDADMALRRGDPRHASKILKAALPIARKKINNLSIDVAKLTARAHVHGQPSETLSDGRT